MIAPALSRLLEERTLSPPDVRTVFDRLVDPAANDVDRVAILVALAARTPSVPELALFASEMRRRATPFELVNGDRPVDLCGSGGAPCPSYNVSTVSAFVVAAAGAPVVKHGNRSARGGCGSSDLLEALGLPVTSSPDFARTTYESERIAFLHAPLYHPATAAVREARRLVGIPTIFNRLGPLSNPARVSSQVVGAPDVTTASVFSEVLARLGVRSGVAMSSREGCDEFSPRQPTRAVVWRHGTRRWTPVAPDRYLETDERRGSWGPLPPVQAAQEADRLLAGGSGARRGSVLLTSGAGLWVSGAVPSLAAGVVRARETVDSGAASALLERIRGLASKAARGGE